MTESVAILGVVIKHSFDLRTYALSVEAEKRLRIESNRAYALKEADFQRLRVDTVLGAVALLSSTGSAAPTPQVTGAIQGLMQLGEHRFGLDVLDQSWAASGIPASTAVRILDQMFNLRDDDLDHAAAEVFLRHVHRIGTNDFPEPFDGQWDTTRTRQVKIEILGAMVALAEYQREHGTGLERPWLLAATCASAMADGDEQISKFATYLLYALIPLVGLSSILYRDRRYQFDTLKTEVHGLVAKIEPGDYWRQRLDAIRAWAVATGPLP